jgi:hypothetical protein
MRRDEMGEDGATWTVPGDRTKHPRTHIVPLPLLAREDHRCLHCREGLNSPRSVSRARWGCSWLE